jgi:hypothetical protein
MHEGQEDQGIVTTWLYKLYGKSCGGLTFDTLMWLNFYIRRRSVKTVTESLSLVNRECGEKRGGGRNRGAWHLFAIG